MEQKITIPEGYELQKVNDSEYRIVKKEPELPNSWEEFCIKYRTNKEERYINSSSEIRKVGDNNTRVIASCKNILPNEEYAESILALCQLIQLRDCYRQGWKPDWRNPQENKYCIEFIYNVVRFAVNNCENRIFSFQSEKIVNKFYDNFKELINKIKPLFM